MSSIQYFTGLHILTSDEFEKISHKDPQGLYMIVDAPITKHNWKHYQDGDDPLFAKDIGALPDKSPVDLDASGGPFIFNVKTEDSIWGDTVQCLAFYDGINNRYQGTTSPVLLLGSNNTVTKTVSPQSLGMSAVRNIIVSSSEPTEEVGANGDVYIQAGVGIFYKNNGSWILSATAILDEYMPKSGGTFTGPVIYAGSTGAFTVTSTAKKAGYFYAGNQAPTSINRINYDGYFYATRVYNAYMADYAEVYSIKEEYKPGMVVVLDSCENDFDVCISYMEYDTNVFGIVSDNYAFCIGGEPDEIHAPIALAGKVPVYIDGSCKKGDYLVTSGKKGYAKAISNLDNIPRGCVIGRALTDSKNNMTTCVIQRM